MATGRKAASGSVIRPPDGAQIMSKEEIAALLGVNPATVRRWLEEGCPLAEPTARGRPFALHLPDVFAWRVRVAEERAGARAAPAADGDYDYETARTLKTAYDAERARVKLLRETGEVVDRRIAAKIVEAELADVRASLQSLPSRLCLDLAVETDKRRVYERMTVEINEVLQALSSPEAVIERAVARQTGGAVALEDADDDE